MCETCRLKSKISGMKKRSKKGGRKMYRRRARVSGIGALPTGVTGILTNIGIAAAGAYVAGFLSKIDMLDNNKTYLGAAQAVAGVATALMVKNDMAKAAGIGMALAGANNLVKSTKLLGSEGEGIFGIPVRTGIAATPEYYGAAPDYSSATMSIEAM